MTIAVLLLDLRGVMDTAACYKMRYTAEAAIGHEEDINRDTTARLRCRWHTVFYE